MSASVEVSEVLASILPKTSLHPTQKMHAVEFQSAKNIKVVERARPALTQPRDAIVRITTAAICGTDLHVIHKDFPGVEKGLVLGHEGVGVIVELGPDCQTLKVGDRVAVTAVIACGMCSYCEKQYYSCCDGTNPSKEQEAAFGHRLAGVFGCGNMLGGYDGCQAEFVRVPLADINLLKLPAELPDETAVLLSDIAPTAYHAVEMGEVKKGDTVAVWGCGPVGLLSLAWAKHRGAAKLIAIDANPMRLSLAALHTGALTIDITKTTDIVKAVQDLAPGGPDVCIEAVGYNNNKSLLHQFQRTVGLETDSPQNLDECARAVKKHGIVSVIGEYVAYANQFPIGILMEKSITLRGGHVPVQKYWSDICKEMVHGKIDLSFILTHRMPLERAAEAYAMFENLKDECVKITLHCGDGGISSVQSK